METPRLPRGAFTALGALGLSVALLGCSAGSTATTSPVPSSAISPPAAASPSPALSAGAGDPDGTVTSPPSDPGGGAVPDPAATMVFPKPGVIAPKPVFVTKLIGGIDAGHVVVRVEWTSGVEPCSTLSSVAVTRTGDAFSLQVLEGPTALDVVCIEIAMFKATLVDLGVLPSGSYTVTADPTDSAPITIVVP